MFKFLPGDPPSPNSRCAHSVIVKRFAIRPKGKSPLEFLARTTKILMVICLSLAAIIFNPIQVIIELKRAKQTCSSCCSMAASKRTQHSDTFATLPTFQEVSVWSGVQCRLLFSTVTLITSCYAIRCRTSPD